ncbi:MAG: hypothetical protein QOE51_1324 [Actinoplanes sp.]|jgi:hypothetical protein|nr:hypothetical protein [Actinoplanes sp.]
MDLSELPEPLRARIAERDARTPVEKVRAFLRGYVADSDGPDEIRGALQRTARTNTRYLRQDLAAMELVLAEPHTPGTLLRLVVGDGNWDLDRNPTDAEAAAVLGELAEMLRTVIDDAA